MPEIKQQRWKSVEYTKRQINDAGNTIRRDDSTEEELDFEQQLLITGERRTPTHYMLSIYIFGE